MTWEVIASPEWFWLDWRWGGGGGGGGARISGYVNWAFLGCVFFLGLAFIMEWSNDEQSNCLHICSGWTKLLFGVLEQGSSSSDLKWISALSTGVCFVRGSCSLGGLWLSEEGNHPLFFYIVSRFFFSFIDYFLTTEAFITSTSCGWRTPV